MPRSFKFEVLAIVRRIPKGEVLSYGEVARRAGNSSAARAVGAILKSNYNSNIPCHRVIRSDGKLGGYNRGGTLQKKRRLIAEGFKRSETKHHYGQRVPHTASAG